MNTSSHQFVLPGRLQTASSSCMAVSLTLGSCALDKVQSAEAAMRWISISFEESTRIWFLFLPLALSLLRPCLHPWMKFMAEFKALVLAAGGVIPTKLSVEIESRIKRQS